MRVKDAYLVNCDLHESFRTNASGETTIKLILLVSTYPPVCLFFPLSLLASYCSSKKTKLPETQSGSLGSLLSNPEKFQSVWISGESASALISLSIISEQRQRLHLLSRVTITNTLLIYNSINICEGGINKIVKICEDITLNVKFYWLVALPFNHERQKVVFIRNQDVYPRF